MPEVTYIPISKEQVYQQAELARQCSSAVVRERVLVSQAVSAAVQESFKQVTNLEIRHGRSSSLKYLEILDICDFKIEDWYFEIRTITTNVEQPALYVPTMPLMVGVFSDFYLCVQVEPSLTKATIFGYATLADLAEADLTANGLFATLPVEELKPFSDLLSNFSDTSKDVMPAIKANQSELTEVFEQWQQRAEYVIEKLNGFLELEKVFEQDQIVKLAKGLKDSIISLYKEQLPPIGLEPLFEKLFSRFGIIEPLPAKPGDEIAFRNSFSEQSRLNKTKAQDKFFQDNLSVGERVVLYRLLLEDSKAMEKHQIMKRVFDKVTAGKHQASPNRRNQMQKLKEHRLEIEQLEELEQQKPEFDNKEDTMVQSKQQPKTQANNLQFKVGQKVTMVGHFPQPVVLEEVRNLGAGYECRVRLADGSLDETVITQEEAIEIFGSSLESTPNVPPADAEQLRLLIESARIRLSYAHDKQFAVSLSGIRTLPHQIEAVYMRMLPQPRLRFLLADDPGAGKTIMAGLLIKEMKLRQAIERVLILCPAPLTLQWQDELLQWFDEEFDIVSSGKDQQQFVNPWRRSSQVITSIDYAKQSDVRERIWEQEWNLVIIDEAHKCAAYTRQAANRSPEANETKRYQLAKKLTAQADHVVLLTATPHHGDEDRFGHFLRLLDADLFPEPHKLQDKATEIRRRIFKLGKDCPWAIRRLKEDLRDLDGRRLFPTRHAQTVQFKLNTDEYALYENVTSYINEFLPLASGNKKASVALARIVLQRRLASSTSAIYESIKRRFEYRKKLLDEIESLTQAKQREKISQLLGIKFDTEQEDEDLDENERDEIATQSTANVEIDSFLDHLKQEVIVLRDLLAQASKVKDMAADSKLAELQKCLKRAEFQELKDGRGKLLIFTEHRDTLTYLEENLEKWGYSVCHIHGKMNVHERKSTQDEFRTVHQICVATEAAGEGINLQFCHLMINYDLPWNPTRLEQRLGRIHRIGQKASDVYCFNFVATESEDGYPIIEGQILDRLLHKLDQMREALEGRVFDVIGDILSINEIDLPKMIQDVTANPSRLDEKLGDIEQIDPNKWRQYEEATGIALARDKFDVDRFKRIQDDNFEAEERRLMPSYVEEQFKAAAKLINLKYDFRADGLLRIDYVPQDLRSDRWESVRRLRKAENSYRKITFNKEIVNEPQHGDAVIVGPGHPLYAVVDEALNARLAHLVGQVGFYIDSQSASPYRIHFFEMSIKGQNLRGKPLGKQDEIYAELVAVKEENGKFEVVPADAYVYLPAHPSLPSSVEPIDIQPAIDFLKSDYQLERRAKCQKERNHYVKVCQDYLTESFKVRIRVAQDRVMQLRARERESSDMALARSKAENDLKDLERNKIERLTSLDKLGVARTGPVRHLATSIVLAPSEPIEEQMFQLSVGASLEAKRASELAAEDCVIKHEEEYGWSCERVGDLKIGFDIRSVSPTDKLTGQRTVRRIEVKGRIHGEPIRLTTNEWLKASQLGSSYWLYVVYNPTSDNPELHKIQDPARVLDHAKHEIVTARMFELSADAVIEAAQRCEEKR